MDTFSLSSVKQMLVSEAYLERMLASRVPFTEVAMGALLWLIIVIGFVRDVDTALWLLSSMVTVPFLMRLARRPTSGPSSAMLAYLGVFSVPLATFTALAFVGPRGFAFLASLPWLGLTALIAFTGLFRLLSRKNLADPMVAMDLGLVLVGLAGLLFSMSRLGIGPASDLGLHPLMFALPAIAGETGRRREQPWLAVVILALTFLVAGAAGSSGVVGVATSAAFFLASWILATWLLRLGAEQRLQAQFPLMVAGLALCLGAGARLAVRALVYLDKQGDASDLFASFDGLLLGAGVIVPAMLGLNLLSTEPIENRERTFLHVGSPTPEQMSRLLEEAESYKLQAQLNPLVTKAPAGYKLHRSSRGVPDFEDSCEALWTWAGHDAAGISILPEEPPILIGQTVVFTLPVGPFTITAAARVVALISDEDHYGFVYSTLDHHPLSAVEAILLDKSSGVPTLDISTVWRPKSVFARLLGPFGNLLLGRVVRRYSDGIAEALTASIGSRMIDVMSEMNQLQYTVSRDSIRSEATNAALSTMVEEPEVTTQPLSEFEALFAQGFDGPEDFESADLV